MLWFLPHPALDEMHVVRVALAHPRRGDAHEPGIAPHLLKRGGSAVADARAQAAHELGDNLLDIAPVGHEGLDSLWDDCLDHAFYHSFSLTLLALDGCARRGHPAAELEFLAISYHGDARALLSACEQAPYHDRGCPSCQGLGDVSAH